METESATLTSIPLASILVLNMVLTLVMYRILQDPSGARGERRSRRWGEGG